MNEQSRLERLKIEARERCAGAHDRREERSGSSPRTGDVLRLDETAELAVLWALVEYDANVRRFLAVAADTSPLVGSTDVEVPPESTSGALSLRCGVEVWLGEDEIDAAHRVGSLTGAIVEEVREKRAEIASGDDVEGRLFAQETDIDPEYRDWMEDGPERAQAALLRKVLPFGAPARTAFFGVPYRVAAAALLAVSLGLGAGLVWQGRELARRSTGEQVSLPFAIFAAGQVRDEAEILEVPSSAMSFLLLVETDTSYPVYRLEIREEDSDRQVWANDELKPTRERTARFEPILLPIVLPREILTSGEYRVLLLGLRGGRAEELEEHLLHVRLK